jgi:hypothetical protein
MAENKKSFVFYCEWIESFEALSDIEAGMLIKHILSYVNDENPVMEDKYVNLAFIPIKQALKRDLKKYETYIDKQISNGKKGGRPKTQKTQAFLEKPKKADNVNVNVNVNDNVITTKEIKVVDEIDVSTNLLNNQKNTEDFLKEIATENHQMWVENLYMKFKLKKGSIGKLLKDFNTHLGIQEKTPKTLKDYKEHFYNWLNTQERIGKLCDYSNKKVGAL